MACFATQATAQSENHRSTVTLNTGYSLIGNLLNASSDTYDVKSFSIPAIQATYDFSLVKWFSIGAAASYQVMGYEYSNYGDNNEGFKTTIYRSNFAIRGLFHYGNSDILDMYSGVRFGMTNWAFKTDYNGTDYDVEQDVSFKNGTIGAPQLVLFGIRGYFFENYGVNMELAIGSPHYFSLGFNYRF